VKQFLSFNFVIFIQGLLQQFLMGFYDVIEVISLKIKSLKIEYKIKNYELKIIPGGYRG